MNYKSNYKEILNDLIIRKHEEEWFEFKVNWFNPLQLGEYVSALSNSAAMLGHDYAYFIWGIDNETHEIVGTNFDERQEYNHEPYQTFLARSLSPSIAFRFEEIIFNEKRIVLLIIPKANRVPTSFLNEKYLRIDSSKIQLKNFPEREALLWKALYEGYPTMENSESPIQDLSFNQLKEYFVIKNLKLGENFIKNLKLLTPNNKFNMLACYLADNGEIPVRIAHFEGVDKERLISVKEFGMQSLLTVIDRIIDYSNSINRIKSIMNFKTGYREDITLFDQSCFNEAIKNAFIHNSWLNRTSPMISFYSDRVEIISFSKLPPNQTIEGFFNGESIPVNETLSMLYLKTHVSERSGFGIPHIVNKYGRSSFTFLDNGIKVVLPYNFLINEAINENKKTLKEELLIKLKEDPSLNYKELGDYFSLGTTTISKTLKELKKEGKIERVGSNKSGYWYIK